MTLSGTILLWALRGPIFQARPSGRPTRVSDPMSDFNRGFSSIPAGRADMAVDTGLRAFMLGVYNKVALGLVLSAALAWLTGMYEPTRALLFRVDGAGHIGYTMLGMVIAFAPLGVLLFQGFARRQSPQSA